MFCIATPCWHKICLFLAASLNSLKLVQKRHAEFESYEMTLCLSYHLLILILCNDSLLTFSLTIVFISFTIDDSSAVTGHKMDHLLQLPHHKQAFQLTVVHNNDEQHSVCKSVNSRKNINVPHSYLRTMQLAYPHFVIISSPPMQQCMIILKQFTADL